VHEAAQAAGFWKPDHGVNVVGHEHEAEAAGGKAPHFLVQNAEHYSLGLVEAQQSTPAVTRKRDEVGVEAIVDASAGRHVRMFAGGKMKCKRIPRKSRDMDWAVFDASGRYATPVGGNRWYPPPAKPRKNPSACWKSP
jgi:hypothetical protein